MIRDWRWLCLSVGRSSVFWGHTAGSVASWLAEKKTRFFRCAGGNHRPKEDLQTGAVRQVWHVFPHCCGVNVWLHKKIFQQVALLSLFSWTCWRKEPANRLEISNKSLPSVAENFPEGESAVFSLKPWSYGFTEASKQKRALIRNILLTTS